MKLSRLRQGFTAAEMLVATSIVAMVVGAAALAYHTMARGQRQNTESVYVQLPTGTVGNFFYDFTTENVTTYVAPNYGSVSRAESMREKFISDCASAVGVYCLYRPAGTYNYIRQATLPSPAAGTQMDTPEAFRQYLIANVSNAASSFPTSYRNYLNSPNYSVFILGYSAAASTIPIIAVYDIDFVQAKDAPNGSRVLGTYAAVRRYVNLSLTDYYDCLYLTGDATDSFTPPVVAFERTNRLVVAETTATTAQPIPPDRFKVAAEQPFYFIWWPDPSRNSLKLPLPNTASSLNATFAATDPRKAYNHMSGRTAYMFTIPMFPSG